MVCTVMIVSSFCLPIRQSHKSEMSDVSLLIIIVNRKVKPNFKNKIFFRNASATIIVNTMFLSQFSKAFWSGMLEGGGWIGFLSILGIRANVQCPTIHLHYIIHLWAKCAHSIKALTTCTCIIDWFGIQFVVVQ